MAYIALKGNSPDGNKKLGWPDSQGVLRYPGKKKIQIRTNRFHYRLVADLLDQGFTDLEMAKKIELPVSRIRKIRKSVVEKRKRWRKWKTAKISTE